MNLGLNWCDPHLGHCRKVWASRCIDKGAALVRVGLIAINEKLFFYGSLVLSPVLCICYLFHDAGSQGGFWVPLDAKLDFNSFEEMEMMPLYLPSKPPHSQVALKQYNLYLVTNWSRLMQRGTNIQEASGGFPLC